jgi:4-amino-4-deoxy-L-arabinose transferase-like glycosyltransferase
MPDLDTQLFGWHRTSPDYVSERAVVEIESKDRPLQRRSLPVSRIAFIALMLCGAFLRFYRLDHYPLPMHQDEVSEAYDAYSIVETGADRTGERLPFVLRAAGPGDYRPALYAWLATVPMRFTGFSVIGGRLPSAVFGVLSLAIVFLFASLLIDQRFGLLTLTFAVFNPWHITYSRLAHEGAMLPAFFVILVLWLWRRAAGREYPTGQIVLIGLVLGLSASAYQSSRLIAPLSMALIAYDLARFSPQRWKSATALVLAAAVGALPQLFVMVTAPEKFFARFRATVHHGAGTGATFETLIRNLGFVFSPKVLFWPDMISTGYVAVRLLPVSLPFFYIGFLTLHRLRTSSLSRFKWYVYVTFVIGILPALVTAKAFSMRISAILLLLPMFTAAGVIWVAQHLSSTTVVKAETFYRGLGVAFVGSIAFVGYMYFGSVRANGQQSNNALVQVGERLKTLSIPYHTVFVVDSPWYAGLHVAAFSGMRPIEFQQTRRVTVDANGWDYITSVGKYRFLKPRQMLEAVRASCGSIDPGLFVSRDKVVGVPPLDSVAWVTEKYYFTKLSLSSRCDTSRQSRSQTMQGR